MKRRAIQAIVFLLLGAIVNVAVAWGCALFIDDSYDVKSWGIRHPLGADIYKKTGRARVVFKIHYLTPLADGEQSEWGTQDDPSWMTWPTDLPADLEAALGSWYVVEYGFGWPFQSLYLSYQVTTKPSHSVDVSHAVVVKGSFVESEPLLPLLPLWPGFAINTIFYAAVLWMIFVMPFALRRRLRIRRGLCPACAYPVGSSPVCTECGKAIAKEADE